jgi:hypothetical protein
MIKNISFIAILLCAILSSTLGFAAPDAGVHSSISQSVNYKYREPGIPGDPGNQSNCENTCAVGYQACTLTTSQNVCLIEYGNCILDCHDCE